MGCCVPGQWQPSQAETPGGKNLGSAVEPWPVTLLLRESLLPFRHSLGRTVLYFLLGKAAFPYFYTSPCTPS